MRVLPASAVRITSDRADRPIRWALHVATSGRWRLPGRAAAWTGDSPGSKA